MSRLLPAAMVAAAMSTPVVAAAGGGYDHQWPQWRGPRADGVAPHGTPPLEWSERKNIRWKAPIPGLGLSTPIIWNDRIFLVTAVRTEESVDPEKVREAEAQLPEWRQQEGHRPSHVVEFVVMAIDRATGGTIWRRAVRKTAPYEGTHIDGSWASASPVTDGRVLVAQFGSYGTYGLDLDGNVLWETDLGDMRTRRGFGEGSSPVIDGDRVFINWDHEGPSFLAALDRRTGGTIWKVERDEVTSWSTPLLVEHDGRRQLIINATGKTRGYDPEDGSVIWEAGGMTVNTIPSPVAAGGRVFVTSGYQGNMLQAIDLAAAKGEITGSKAIAWRHDRDTPYVPSPLLYGGRLYFLKKNNGILSAFDADSGKAHYGPVRLEMIDGVYASPVGAAGRVYIAGRNGTTLAIANADELKVLATNHLDDSFSASPAVAGDALFLRGLENLYCIAE
jgi:outer membrane protein assembly factor BamB